MAGRASRRGSAKCVQAGTAVRRTLSRYNRAQRSGSLCIRHAYLHGIRWRRSPVTTLLTVYRHPIHRQPLRQPLLAIFFQAISLHPKHLHHSCSGRSGRASQPVPRHFAALPGSQFLETPNEPRTGGGERSTSQTPAPPRFGLPTPTRGGGRPRLSALLPPPAASRSPWPSPISGPSPHHAQPRPSPAPALWCVRGPWAAPGSVWVRAELEACACAERSSVTEPQESSRAVPLGLTRVRFQCSIGLRHAPWLRSRNDLGQGGRGGQRVETVSSHYSVDRLSPSNPSSDLSSTPSGNFLSSHLFVS